MLVVCELGLALPGLDRDGHDLRLEATLVPSGLGPLLAVEGDLVGFFTRDLVAPRQLLRRLGHGQIAVRVPERLPEQIFEGAAGRSEPKVAPTGSPQNVRRLAHGLGAPAECHVSATQQDLLGTLDDGLEAGAAQPVDRHGRLLLGDARAERDVARKVDGVRRSLQRVAKESVVDLISRDARRLDGGLAREHTQIGGSEALQASPERPEGGPFSRKDHDVLWLPLRSHRVFPFPKFASYREGRSAVG